MKGVLTELRIEEKAGAEDWTAKTGGGEERSSWRGRRRAAPVALVPRVVVRARCEASGEVRRVGTPTAARN